MMMHRVPISSASCRARRALVCKASKNSDVKAPFAALPRMAAAVAAASLLLLGSSPVLPADAQTYEEELQSLIEQRRGSAFKPELTVSPGEEERQKIAERQLIEEAIAKDTAPLVVEAAQASESAIKAQALEESAAAQLATSGAVTKPGAVNRPVSAAKSGASTTYGGTDAGPVASNLTGLLVGGGLLTVAAAAAALSNNNAAGGTEPTAAAPAPPATTPSDAAPSSSTSGTQAGPTSSA